MDSSSRTRERKIPEPLSDQENNEEAASEDDEIIESPADDTNSDLGKDSSSSSYASEQTQNSEPSGVDLIARGPTVHQNKRAMDDGETCPRKTPRLESNGSSDSSETCSGSSKKAVVESNRRRKGLPRRNLRQRPAGYDIHCAPCDKWFQTQHHYDCHVRDTHKSSNCAYCKVEFINSKLDYHLKHNKCEKMDAADKERQSKGKLCPAGNCSFNSKRWQKMVSHLKENHPRYIDVEYFKPPVTSPKPLANFKPLPIVKQSEVPKASMPGTSKNLQPVPSFPTANEFDDLLSLVILPSGTTIEPTYQLSKTKSSIKYGRSLHIRLGHWGYFSSFRTFVRFFHESGLAQSGGVVVSAPSISQSTEQQELFFQKLKSVVVGSVTSQTVKESFEGDKLLKIDQEEIQSSEVITDFAKSSTTSPPKQTSHKDLVADILSDIAKRIESTKNHYAADVNNSLFDYFQEGWNLRRLENDLTDNSINFFRNREGDEEDMFTAGIASPYLYIGKYCTFFCLHKEDSNLGAISYLHYGAPKVWFVIPPEYARRLEQKMAQVCADDAKTCEGFLCHRWNFVHPDLLDEWEIPFSVIIQPEKSYVVLGGGAYHQGFNIGFNISESVNYLTEEIVPYFKMVEYECYCEPMALRVPRNNVVGKYDPDRFAKFVKGEDKDYFPHDESKTLHKALNDAERDLDYFRKHLITREKNNNTNQKYGKTFLLAVNHQACLDRLKDLEKIVEDNKNDPDLVEKLKPPVFYNRKEVEDKRTEPAFDHYMIPDDDPLVNPNLMVPSRDLSGNQGKSESGSGETSSGSAPNSSFELVFAMK